MKMLSLLLITFLLVACNPATDNKVDKNLMLSYQANQSALSDIANEGKALFATCNACHNQSNNPAKAPPMFAVKKHYNNSFPEKDEFIENMVAFVEKPSKENALLKRPVKMLGLMPPMPLGKESLTKIATYIYEEKFSKPCQHWKIMIEAAEKEGKVDEHIQHDIKKYNRHCIND